MPIDKDALYGTFNAGARENRSLYDTAIRKALDLPPEAPTVTSTKSGISGWQLVAALLVLAAGGLGWQALATFLPAAAGVAKPQEFAVEFFTEDGEPIAIEAAPLPGP